MAIAGAFIICADNASLLKSIANSIKEWIFGLSGVPIFQYLSSFNLKSVLILIFTNFSKFDSAGKF